MKLKTIYIKIIILVTIIIPFFMIAKGYGGDMKITKERVIEIANKEAKKLGYDIESMNLKITKYNTPWNEYLPNDSKSDYDIERKKKLVNREYWAVYYYPKQEKNYPILGGDICIFVDSRSGEIITNIRGK